MKAVSIAPKYSTPQAPTGSMEELLDRASLLVAEGMSPRVPEAQRYNLRLASFAALADIDERARKNVAAVEQRETARRSDLIATAWMGAVAAFCLGVVIGALV